MPKISKHPGLRHHTRRGKAGQVWTNYYLDRRSEGLPDLPLGKDYDVALAKWKELRTGVSPDRGLVREALAKWIAEELPKYDVPKTLADYTRHANRMLAWCGHMRWDQVTLPLMVEYRTRRSAKTQANRELAVLSIVWGHARQWGMTKLVWPALGVKKWKNPEKARENVLDMEVFEAIYVHADQVLRDAMDLASATGVRLTDARTIELPDDHRIELDASKTGKAGWFDVRKSAVLPALLERRRAIEADTVYLLCTIAGKAVSERTLSTKWSEARKLAANEALAAGNQGLAERIARSWMKDNRKLAADLVGSTAAAQKLLQHSNQAVTRKHYRGAADELDPAR